MSCIHLATALVRRDDCVLLVASRYPNHRNALWHLPGGRQQAGELLELTAIRELREETSLEGEVRELAYVSESYDGDTHFTNFTFEVEVARPSTRGARSGALRLRVPLTAERSAQDDNRNPHDDNEDHIEEAEWVPLSELGEKIEVAVVREPLLAYLRGNSRGYAGYAEAGITIVFPD